MSGFRKRQAAGGDRQAPRRPGLRWKFVLTAFLCAAVPLYLLNRYTIAEFDRFTRSALENEMVGHAHMVGALYRVGLPAAEFNALLHAFSTNTESRLQVVDTNGVVRFDGTGTDVGADLGALPEIQRARHGRYGARWELTPDRRFVYYYCAVPVRIDGHPAAIVRVTRHTGPIMTALRLLSRSQRWALAAALAFAAAVSVVLAQTLTRRLRRLTAATRDYARGRAPALPRISGTDEIGELGAAIDRMARELESRHRYNRDFVATTLHELKTPVTAIRGAVEVLEAGAVDRPEARAKFLANLRFEADRLARLVEGLGELTRVDEEDIRERRSVVDYPQCLRAIVDRLLPTFEDPHAPLSVELPETTTRVSVVPERIEQVLGNLLENAFRYTPPTGSVVLSVTTGEPQRVTTVVADTGPGIPPQNLERIFDRFYTTEPKGVPRDYGMGLGLAVAKAIVENHQGRIWAENRPDGGARFCFSLPTA